ncbi:hypothetical protein ADL03_32535 [Nocardia sp. NRRL S-836]|nr:hypothetical protein ADL03_32535 [Nocardia sp. NRRL S-836]
MNDLARLHLNYEEVIRFTFAVDALDLKKLHANRGDRKIDWNLTEVVHLSSVRVHALHLAVVEADSDGSTLGVREGDDRRSEIARFQEYVLPVIPLVFRCRQEQGTHVASGRCECCLNFRDRHRATLNFLE